MKYKDLNNAINKKINIKNIVTRDDMIDYCKLLSRLILIKREVLEHIKILQKMCFLI